MRRRTFAKARALDTQTIGDAFRRPGMDPRQWFSYGIVKPGKQGDEIVVFDEEIGYPLVSVILEPSKVPVRCRVGGRSAGNGEGEWDPFVEGDEVFVGIPEGNERAACVILGRLNNQLDRFPMNSVAGQDPTTNAFAFTRRRTPFLQEYAGPIMLRSAMTGAFFSVDTAGVVTIRDGEGAAIQLSPDLVGMQGPSSATSPPRFLFQCDLNASRTTLQQGNALFQQNAEGATWIVSPTQLIARQGADHPGEHVATVEFVLAMLGVVSRAITVLGGGEPSTGGAVQTAINLAVSLGGAPLMPTDAAALSAGLLIAGASPKLPPVGVQMLPKLGAINFITG